MRINLDMPPEAWEIQKHLNEDHLHTIEGQKVAIHGPQPYEVLNAVAMSIEHALSKHKVTGDMKHYEVNLKLTTVKPPEELVEVLKKLFRDEALHVMSYDFKEIDPRDTNLEHHGGYQS